MAAEKNFENKIKKYLDGLGAWYIKYWSGGISTKQGVRKFTKDGIPDLLCCVNGYFVAIEVKAQNGKPSELQLHAIDEIRKAQGFAVVAYPSGWGELKTFLDGLLIDRYEGPREMKIIFK